MSRPLVLCQGIASGFLVFWRPWFRFLVQTLVRRCSSVHCLRYFVSSLSSAFIFVRFGDFGTRSLVRFGDFVTRSLVRFGDFGALTLSSGSATSELARSSGSVIGTRSLVRFGDWNSQSHVRSRWLLLLRKRGR